MVSGFMGPLWVNNTSKDQSVFQTNVWLNGINMNMRKCNNRLVRHSILWWGQSALSITLTALSPWLRIYFSRQVDAVKRLLSCIPSVLCSSDGELRVLCQYQS